MLFEPELWEEFLLKLRYRKARLLKTPIYQPHVLDAPQGAWLVYAGAADVFSVPLAGGQVVGTRQHLFHVPNGGLVFGAELSSAPRGMLLMQSPDAELLYVEREDLWGLLDEMPAAAPILISLIENWARMVTGSLMQSLPPQRHINLVDERAFEAEDIIRPLENLLWVQHQSGASWWMDQVLLAAGEPPFPLTKSAWLVGDAAGFVVGAHTSTILEDRAAFFTALDAFHNKVIASLATHAENIAAQNQARFAARTASDAQQFQSALVGLAQTLNPHLYLPPSSLTHSATLLAACRLVGEAGGISIQPPSTEMGGVSIETIADASGIRFRQVALRGEWWQEDNGALLAHMADDQRPVALIPTAPNAYRLYDPQHGTQQAMTAQLAAQLGDFATMFYRRLPPDTDAPKLLRFALFGARRDLLTIMGVGVGVGLLQISIPLFTTLLLDQVIPVGQVSQLWQVGLLLLVVAAATFVFQLTQRIAVLRVESRAESSIQAAMWDRLLALRPTFYRQFSAGDLGARMLGISDIRAILSGSVSMSVLLVLFSGFNLALMLYYNVWLALAAFGLLVLAALVMVYAGYRSMRLQQALHTISGKNAGYLLELVNGVSKFRVAGAEPRAFSVWAGYFTQQRHLTYQVREIENRLSVFNAVYPLVALWVVFALVGGLQPAAFSVGQFVGFNAAFTQFIMAGLAFSQSLILMLGTLPLYQRLQPVLQAQPESHSTRAEYAQLGGRIELNHVSFRYDDEQPMVLEDISFAVEPGEFVALVGASGSGKSTLLRLLLGFEQPASGAIYYDGKDLSKLNLRGVRRQIGVVLQNARLASGGSIFENIIGNSPLSIEDAWQAARMVGLDADIKAMPMGMHTVLTEGGGTLSGGQRQRLLIAAAIVHKPRLIFFDEATSALDNETQRIVSESLENLNATRLVIAHRLSTIINADRIIVLDRGHIAQMGSYQTLAKQPGIFAEMVRRQIL